MNKQNTTYLNCPICLEEYDTDNKNSEYNETIILKCNHKFHLHCIMEWIDNEYSDQKCVVCKDNRKINIVFNNIHKLNFNSDKIINHNYDIKYFHRKPVYNEDMHIKHYNTLKCKNVKEQLMNAIPADITYNKEPIYILKSEYNTDYTYISAYYRTLLLFTPDYEHNKEHAKYFTAENTILYTDDISSYRCIINNDNALKYISKADYYHYCKCMSDEIFVITYKYPNYETILTNYDHYTILSDLFISNLKNLAETNNFKKMTTISETNTQNDIDKYKKRIYYTIASISVYAYMNMNGAQEFAYFSDTHHNNFSESIQKSLEKFIYNRMQFDISNASYDIYRRINNHMENPHDDQVINIEDIIIDMNQYTYDNYIDFTQIIPTLNYTYYNIIPEYSAKDINIFSIFCNNDDVNQYDLFQEKINHSLKCDIAFLMIAVFINLLLDMECYKYDIDIYSNITNNHHIYKYQIISLNIICRASFIYILMSINFTNFYVISKFYNIINNYYNFTNINCTDKLIEYDWKVRYTIYTFAIIFALSVYACHYLWDTLSELNDISLIIDNEIKNMSNV